MVEQTITQEHEETELSEIGVSASPQKRRTGIEQSAYSFGNIIRLAQYVYEIYTKE